MKRILSCCVVIAAAAFLAPGPATAAFLSIDDTLSNDLIRFSESDFEGGFFVDGAPLRSGLHVSDSRTVAELIGGTPRTRTFSGSWIDRGFTTPGSFTVNFLEPGVPPSLGVSDILTYSYFTDGFFGHLNGTFTSDGERLLPFRPGGRLVAEGRPIDFSNAFITARAISEATDVPEPGSAVLLATGLLGLAAVRRRRRTR
jgi:hypothetical protein